MKIKFALIGVLTCLFSVYAFAKSKPMSYYQVDPEKVEAYAKQNMLKDTTEAFEILDGFNSYFFESRTQMAEKILEALNKFPQYHKITNNFIQASWTIIEDTTTDKMGMLNMRVLMKKRALDSLKWYIKDDQKKMTYSKTANEFLENMQGIIFPDSVLAHHYALSLFAASIGVCNDSVVNRYVKDVEMKWDENKLRELLTRRQLDLSDFMNPTPTKRKNPNNDINRVIDFLKKFNGRVCSDNRWKMALKKLDTLYNRSLADLVTASMTKTNFFDDKSSVSFNGKKCGCSQVNDLNGEVFGFYPYWLMGDTTTWVDFEGITRLSYYGLRAADDGSLELPSGMLAKDYLNDEKNYEFVNDAHRHYVKLDWVIAKDNWDGIESKGDLKKFFDKLTNEIDELLNKKISSSFERFVNALTFYINEYEYRGDGVTLYFKNYPKTAEATQAFNKFFENLQRQLSAKNKNVLVNFMADRLALAENENVNQVDNFEFDDERGIYSYSNFAKIFNHPDYDGKIKDSDLGKNRKNYLFVLEEEPISRSKRLLLNDLNQQLNGTDRRNVLHSLVPVLWFDNKQWTQLREDAMYYSDTYYALAIAPYVSSIEGNDSCRASGNIGMCMLQYFEVENGDNERQGCVAAFICTHRWAFHFVNYILYFIAIGVLVSYLVSCRVSNFFNSHLALLLEIVVLPSAIMTSVLARLDPSVTVYRGTFGMIPVLVLLVSSIVIILLQVNRKNDIPTRRDKFKGK